MIPFALVSLPNLRQRTFSSLSSLISKADPRLQKVISTITTKRHRYFLGIALDITCLLLILINGAQPAVRLISPLVASVYSGQLTQIRQTGQNFSFVPGQAQNKFKNINVTNLNTLAFFDVPLNEENSIRTSSRGYVSFKSDTSNELFSRAHLAGAKVVVTLTQSDTNVLRDFLRNPHAQQNLIDQAITEVQESGIDGVALDFEPQGNFSADEAKKFSNFIANFSNQMHQQVPNSLVTVAIPSQEAISQGLFDLKSLGQNSDQLMVIAANFAVPEQKSSKPLNPVFGYDENQYWNDVTNSLRNFTAAVPANKLSLERAWYGDGDHYPLYIPNSKPDASSHSQPAVAITMDQTTLDHLVQGVPSKARAAARHNIPIIAQALQDEGILNSNVLAYALATIEHETAETFEPIDEIQGQFSARRLGYEGGMDYYGRGFIQLTHLRNYRMIGERIGLGDQLARHPEMASTPEVAAKVLAAFFKDNNVANLASRGAFVAARTPVNPDRNGGAIAMLAMKYAE